MIFFSCSYGPVVWVFISEIFPLEIKAAATGSCAAIHWISALLVVGITQLISHRAAFSLFAVMGAIAYVIIHLLVEETKGRHVDNSPYLRKEHPAEASNIA